MYPTIHSSRHLIYICIRTFPYSPFPVSVCARAISVWPPCLFIRIILSLFTFSNICLYPQHHLFVLSIPVFISGPSSTRHFCTVFASIPSSPPYPNHHLLTHSALCFLPGSFNFDIGTGLHKPYLNLSVN